MKCIKCGTENNNGEYFCRNCGYNLSLINYNKTKKNKRDNYRKQSNKKQNKLVEKKYELIVILILFFVSLINALSLIYSITSYLLLINIISIIILLILIINKLNKKLLILLLIPILIYGFCFYQKGNTVENSVKEVINKTSLSGDWICKLNKDEFYLNLSMTSKKFSFTGKYMTVEGKIVASNKTKVEGEHEIIIDTTKNVQNGIVVLNEGKMYYTKIKDNILYLIDNGSGETYKCKK